MDAAIVPWHFFDPQGQSERLPRARRRAATAPKRESRLFCARCRHVITDESERVAMNGAHAHTCTNPHGITFHIGCFRRADGCSADAGATTEHTWFPGYAWQIAYCAHCSTHLGWRFISGTEEFYGLIVDRLVGGGAARP